MRIAHPHRRQSGGLIAALCLLPATYAWASGEITVTHIDGSTLTGTLLAAPSGEYFDLQTADGVKRLPLSDLSRLVFSSRRKPFDPSGLFPPPPNDADATPETDEVTGPVPAVFHLADGGRLPGQLLTAAEGADGIVATTRLADSALLAFDFLAGVQLASDEFFPNADKRFQRALSNRQPGEDLLVTREVEEVKSVRGRLERMGADAGTFAFDGRSRSFQTAKIYGVVLAVGVAGSKEQSLPLTVSLADGSRFTARPVRTEADGLILATSIGATTAVTFEELLTIDVRSDRVVSLSSLPVDTVRAEGLLHKPWPFKLDTNVAGGPIILGGRSFDRGLGMHSLTELRFDLSGDYESLAATIGIDDAVRPRGSVVFRVTGDGETLFDSGTVTGRDEPRNILVTLSGVKRMTLIVDYGDEMDLSDHADWAGARLIKPASTPGGGS